MACTYLLTLGDQPSAPQLERSYTPKQWAKRRTDNTIGVLPEEGRAPSSSLKSTPSVLLPSKESDVSDTVGIIDSVGEPAHPSNPSPPCNPKTSFTHSLKGVLDLHTARRMKSPPPPSSSELEKKKVKVKQGVSIPSQRRWLYYWALLLAGEAPKDVWPIDAKRLDSAKPRVRLTQINVRMRETSSVKLGIVKAASLIIGRAGLGKAPGAATQESPSTTTQVWASLARYDDSLVELLEKWELWTRNEGGGLGAPRRPGSECMPRKKDGDDNNSDVDDVSKVFEDGRWDKEKMVRPFARFGEVGFFVHVFPLISYSLFAMRRTSPKQKKKRIKTKTPR